MSLTYVDVLKRALLAGLFAGVLSGAYLLVVMEPVITDAIALEEQLAEADPVPASVEAQSSEADHTHDEDALVGRRGQLLGGFTSSVILGLVVSLVFATVFSQLRHRLPGWSDFQRSMWLAGAGFLSVSLIPGLKYPANPPAVGDPDSVGERSVQWISAVVLAIIIVIVLTRLSSVLRDRLDAPVHKIAVAAASVVSFAALMIVLPSSPDAISPDIPAALVWDFRIRSIGGLALLWSVLGASFGWLLVRHRDGDQVDAPTLDRQSA